MGSVYSFASDLTEGEVFDDKDYYHRHLVHTIEQPSFADCNTMDSAFAIPTQEHPHAINHKPNAIDLSHHLNSIAVHRAPNQLKELYRYMGVPGMITMAGGIPSPELFPFETLSADVLTIDSVPLDQPRVPKKPSLFSWLWQKPTTSFTIPKYAKNPTATTIQLATSLQYQSATGPPALPLFLREYVERVYKPAYADWDVLLNCGATDAWGKIVFMLMERGDAILVEEWTYPGAENSFIPLETEMVPIKMDGQGVLPGHLEEVLSTWDEVKRGKRRPKVFYTVPTGQNPTGATMLGERKKQIYDICVKYDVIICEDEPYYCLYTGPWTPRSQEDKLSPLARRNLEAEKKEGREGQEAFLRALPPTYLTYDYQGRVIRMDTFSKTSCPGSRLGWFTTSPLFIERLTRATEASTQAPSGFATAMTATLLQRWGFDGYIRWLRGIKATYRTRRNWLCDTFEDFFHLEFDAAPMGVPTNAAVRDVLDFGRGVTCYSSTPGLWDEKRGSLGPPLISFIPPSGGMFVFLAVHLDQHPDFDSLESRGEDATKFLLNKLWQELADQLVLFAPGWAFDANGPHAIGGKGTGYFRLSYSIATYEETRKAIGTFAKVLQHFYRL